MLYIVQLILQQVQLPDKWARTVIGRDQNLLYLRHQLTTAFRSDN